MAYLSPAKVTSLTAQKERLEDLLEEALDAYEATLQAGQTQSYKFSDGEGSQSVVKRSLREIQETIDYLESRIDFIDRRLNKGLIGSLNVRRKRGSGRMGRE